MNNEKNNIEKLDFMLIEHEKLPYTILNTHVIQNITNPVAGFMWVFLQSLPSNWKVNKFHLMKHFDISERTYQRHMAYLSSSNLIQHTRTRFANGTLGSVNLRVLNGSKFRKDAASDHTAKFDIVDFNHTAKKPHCGETTVVGFGTLTNTIDITNTNKDITNTRDSTKLEQKNNSSINKAPFFEEFKKAESADLELVNDEYNKKQLMLTYEKEALSCEKCLEVFNRRFVGIPITLKELYEDCADYWRQKGQMVYKSRFLSHLKKCPVSKFQETATEITPIIKSKYPTKQERETENKRINEREKIVNIRKQEEIEDSKTFQIKLLSSHVDLKKIREKQELERVSLGMTVLEYHDYITRDEK